MQHRRLLVISVLLGTAVLVGLLSHPSGNSLNAQDARSQRGTIADILHDFRNAPVRVVEKTNGHVLEILRDRRGNFERLDPGRLYIHSVGVDYVMLQKKNQAAQKLEAEEQTYLPTGSLRVEVKYAR